MKKLLCVVFVLLLLVGCSPVEEFGQSTKTDSYITGVWVSFSELDQMLAGNFKDEFDTVIKNCKLRGISDMFVHIRPYCDAIYNSSLFPLRESAKGYDFDILAYMIELCHKNGIRLHAWINPYRVRTADSEIGAVDGDSPAAKWLADEDAENDINVLLENGIYLNPASSEVRALITDGVREVIDNYDIDGIHFDDYFYPTTSESFDEASYTRYRSNTKNPLLLAEWRRANVNALISAVYTAVKFKDKSIIFSISPSASVEENHNKHYADVAAWINSECVDYIVPQLYFGFDYPDAKFGFNNLVNEWKDLVKGSNVKLLIGLASYKINTDSEPDKVEWANGIDVINRQIEACKQDKSINGHIFFSYGSMIKYLKK